MVKSIIIYDFLEKILFVNTKKRLKKFIVTPFYKPNNELAMLVIMYSPGRKVEKSFTASGSIA